MFLATLRTIRCFRGVLAAGFLAVACGKTKPRPSADVLPSAPSIASAGQPKADFHPNDKARIEIKAALKRGPAFVVRADSEQVRLADIGSGEAIRWADIRRISILTTNEGPEVTDVFINLEGESSRLIIPQDARENDMFIGMLLKIQGFDLGAFTKAMGSAENAEFQCWSGSSVSFRP
jgi:hypothetical protein